MKPSALKTIESEVFERLQRVARELGRAERLSERARQTYIATREETHRRAWIEALQKEKQSWDRYWSAHTAHLTESS